MKLTLITPPAALPVSVPTAKAQSRIPGDAEDALVELYLAAATAELDGPLGVIGRCFMTQTWRLELPSWQGPVPLRVEPVSAVEVRYLDSAGDEQVLSPASYAVDNDVGRSPRLYWRGSLPGLGDDAWPVKIDITAGHAEAQPDVKVAILLRAADLYEQREAQITGTIGAVNPAYDAIVAKLRRKI